MSSRGSDVQTIPTQQGEIGLPGLEFITDWSRRYLAAWNGHDPDGVAALCAEEIVWDDPSLPSAVHGREAVRKVVAETVHAFPDFRVEETLPPLVAPNGQVVLSRYELTGTMRGGWEASGFAATGASLRLAGVDQWTFAGEAMVHYTSYYDSLDVGRQLGIMPAVGSRADRAMVLAQHAQARFQRLRRRRSLS